MIVYEFHRSKSANYLYHQEDENLIFPVHMHKSLEFLCVESGSLQCSIEDQTFSLTQGKGLLILPNQLHSYHTTDHSKTHLWIFSGDQVPEFYAKSKGCRFVDPLVTVSVQQVLDLFQCHDNPYLCRAALYYICGTVMAQCQLRSAPVADDYLPARIIDYVQEHYQEEISLMQMAKALGYNYSYLSAFFHQTLHTSFHTFVNQYRIDHARILLRTSDLPITEIAGLCGFSTIRSFNRSFLQLCGMTPSAFRKQS